MWMMGYNDGADLNMSDNFNGRSKLRPLIPRSMTAASNSINNVNTSSLNPPCFSRVHPGTDFFSLNHHLASVTEQSKRDYNTQPVLVSSRWNPTPEQLRTLEELYRRGTRTPSAEQIQHITAQLRRYGKIEGKNVFYWFQNHKARERQKRRRQMESAGTDHEQQQHKDMECLEKKDSGSSRTAFEVEQSKNWAPSTNCSALSEESISIQRASKAAAGAAVGTECKTDGWLQFDEGELQQRRNFMEKNATWSMMQLSRHPHPHTHTTHHPIKSIPTAAAVTTVDPKLIKTHHEHLNIYVSSYRAENSINPMDHVASNEENGCGESLTLELFPLRSSDGNNDINPKETDEAAAGPGNAATNSNDFTTPHQFYEFLPLKK